MPLSFLGPIASLIGIGGSIAGLAGGPDSAYTPQNQQGADQAYQKNLFGQTHNAQLGNILARNVVNNPYERGVIPGAQRAGHYLTHTLGPELQRDSTRLANEGDRGFAAANAELRTAFDPQHALYNRTLQQTQDQTLAGLSATGVGSSPYGAGVLGQTLGNFNIDWRNNRLAREQSGLQSYGQYLGQGGNAYTAGGNLGNAAAGAYAGGAALPYSTYVGMQNNGLGALTQGSNLNTAATSAASGYLGLGQSGQQIGFNQGQQLGAGLGGALQTLSGYGNQLPSVSGGTYGSPLQYQPTQGYQDPGAVPAWGG